MFQAFPIDTMKICQTNKKSIIATCKEFPGIGIKPIKKYT